MKGQKKKQEGITLIALVISIIVMLILAGVSLNAVVGENGIISQAKDATFMQSCAELEEFLKEYYMGNFEVLPMDAENKAEALEKYSGSKSWFWNPSENGYGSVGYVITNDGKACYFIDKESFEANSDSGIKLQGGFAGEGTYLDYSQMNDVYGVTSDLKVYYCAGDRNKLLGANNENLDEDNPIRTVFNSDNETDKKWYEVVKKYDVNEDGKISAQEAKGVKSIVLTATSGITSLEYLYNFPNLEEITFESINYQNLNGIQDCYFLSSLFFKSSTVQDYSAIEKISNSLTKLYFYNLDNTELTRICNDLKNAELTKLQYLVFSGNAFYITNSGWSFTSNHRTSGYVSGKSAKTITTLEPLSNLSAKTKQAVKYLCVNNNNITDQDLSFIADFTNLYLLRCEYNSLKSLKGLKNMNNLTYLYAQYNKLGTDCTENGSSVDTDCLGSLKDKDRLYFCDFVGNTNLRYVDYLASDSSIRYLYMKDCSRTMNANPIQSIIVACRLNYSLPVKFLSGAVYSWLDYYYTNTAETGKEQFSVAKLQSDLTNNTNILALDLHNCNDSTVTDSVLNNILKTMPQIQYLRLDSTNLTNIDFVGSSYCNNLIEFDIRNTYVTELNALNSNSRNFGALRFNSTNIKNADGTSKLKLKDIQNVISNVQADAYWLVNGWLGLNLLDTATIKLMEECTSVTRIYAPTYANYMWNQGSLDLTGLTSCTYVLTDGWGFAISLPSSVKTADVRVSGVPILAAGTDATSVVCGWGNNNSWNPTNWTRFWTGIASCSNIDALSIYYPYALQSSYISASATGSNIKKLNLCTNNQDLSAFAKLTELNKLYINGNSYTALNYDWINNLTKLTELTLTNAKFSKTLNISSLTKLTDLSITNTDLADITSFATLIDLVNLNLSGNAIVSCIPLMNMSKLEVLNLTNNSLSDWVADDTGRYSNLSIFADLNYQNTNLTYRSQHGSLKELYLSKNKNIMDYDKVSKLSWTNKDF